MHHTFRENRVTVKVMVIDVHEPEKVGKNKMKQDVSISDATGVATLTLWECVRSYIGKKQLSLPQNGAKITKIEDIGDIQDDSDELDAVVTTMKSVKVIAGTPASIARKPTWIKIVTNLALASTAK